MQARPGRSRKSPASPTRWSRTSRRSRQKKFRDQQNAFMAEGLKLVIDALDLGWQIRTLVFAKAGRGNAAVEKVAARTVAAGGTVLEVSEKVLVAITRRDNPQMVVGVFSQKFLAAEGHPRRQWRRLGGARPGARSRQSRHRHPHRRCRRRQGRHPGRRHHRSFLASRRCAPPWARSSPCRWPRQRPRLSWPGAADFQASSPARI